MNKTKSRILVALTSLLAALIVLETVGTFLGTAGLEGWRNDHVGQTDPGIVRSTEARKAILRRRIASAAPSEVYIIVDTAANILYLKKGDRVIRQAVVSCGSGSILDEPGGGRKWVFDTPHGEFSVQSKVTDPTWRKPDWAFIEEGEEIPRNPSQRLEEGVLGDYALGIGNNYFIHGTLYTRLLGRNVTHGCIRVGDEDLKAVFRTARIGTRVFIF